MPRELKKRGRREDKKRKAQEVDDPASPKRARIDTEENPELVIHGDAGDDFISFNEVRESERTQYDSSERYNIESNDSLDQAPPQHDQFYGLLEEDEQSYYASVNNKLSANDFESDEDRALFIDAVHRETQGKELKVASSQSCSRYLEKVILLSTGQQLKSLFAAFLENIIYLVQHRFGSHCCEALFVQAARHVTVNEKVNEEEITMESLFLRAVEDLQSNVGYLVTDRFATHTVRVLMLVLSGEPLTEENIRTVASKKKEKLDIPESVLKTEEVKRKVPASFKQALESMISSAVSTLDTTYIRALATHPTGNPFLQLVLRLELTTSGSSKDRTKQLLYQKLFPDPELESESESGKFIQGLIYDPTGSHLVEVLIKNLPGKAFKNLYGNILKEKMGNLARNDIASYIAIRVLERLGKDDLIEAQEQILPEVQGLVSRFRLGLIKVLLERLAVRQADTTPLVDALKTAYGQDDSSVLLKILQFDAGSEQSSGDIQQASRSPVKADLHGSLMAQSLLNTSNACEMIQESLTAQPTSTLVLLSKNSIASRVIQVALTSTTSTTKFRRQFIPKFYGTIAELAQDSAGSHVVDALWTGTDGSHFMKERLAKELAAHESVLRESMYGRTVWRNWSMDTYQRRFRDWQALAKGYDQEKPQEQEGQPKKSAIQLARERHVKAKSTRKPDSGNVQSATVSTNA